jgi:hypothetical protein
MSGTLRRGEVSGAYDLRIVVRDGARDGAAFVLVVQRRHRRSDPQRDRQHV